jgi:hypothetical protein
VADITFDVAAFLQSFAQMQNKIDANGAVAFRNAVRKACEAQKEFGYQNKTGRLTSSMKWQTTQKGQYGWRGEVTTSAPYALWVNEPTKPHNIPGPGKGPSVFFWPKIGRWVKFTSDRPAKHPGTKAAGFTGAAVQTFGQSAPLEIERAITAAAK